MTVTEALVLRGKAPPDPYYRDEMANGNFMEQDEPAATRDEAERLMRTLRYYDSLKERDAKCEEKHGMYYC